VTSNARAVTVLLSRSIATRSVNHSTPNTGFASPLFCRENAARPESMSPVNPSGCGS
jgi:hypothetical protein